MGHAEILYISEITKGKLQEKVRILGKIIDVDMPWNRFKLEFKQKSIWVDSSLLKEFPHSRVTLYEVTGEVVSDPRDDDALLVKARIIRNVQDLDLRLFDLVLKERRKQLGK